MAEYTDKDKLLNAIECIDISDCTDIDDIFIEIERTIDEHPTADVVEVVRCKECKNHNRPRLGYCSMTLCLVNSDDFCSYGKRKGGNDNV